MQRKLLDESGVLWGFTMQPGTKGTLTMSDRGLRLHIAILHLCAVICLLVLLQVARIVQTRWLTLNVRESLLDARDALTGKEMAELLSLVPGLDDSSSWLPEDVRKRLFVVHKAALGLPIDNSDEKLQHLRFILSHTHITIEPEEVSAYYWHKYLVTYIFAVILLAFTVYRTCKQFHYYRYLRSR